MNASPPTAIRRSQKRWKKEKQKRGKNENQREPGGRGRGGEGGASQLDRFNRVWLIAMESTLVKVAHLERDSMLQDPPCELDKPEKFGRWHTRCIHDTPMNFACQAELFRDISRASKRVFKTFFEDLPSVFRISPFFSFVFLFFFFLDSSTRVILSLNRSIHFWLNRVL